MRMTAVLLLLLAAVLLQGCESSSDPANAAESTRLPAMPDSIEPTFAPLMLSELVEGEPSSNWTFAKSFPFGAIGGNAATLEAFELPHEGESSIRQIHGVLKVAGTSYLIPDLAYSILDNQSTACPSLCLFGRTFAGQSKYELIGSVELLANGGGRNLYIVYDSSTEKLLTFEAWGEASFLDLDADRADEFVIEFRGQHLHGPDAAIVRTVDGELEITSSVIESVMRSQGEFTTIDRNHSPPLIRISNSRSDNEAIYDYEYDHGVLRKAEEKESRG